MQHQQRPIRRLSIPCRSRSEHCDRLQHLPTQTLSTPRPKDGPVHTPARCQVEASPWPRRTPADGAGRQPDQQRFECHRPARAGVAGASGSGHRGDPGPTALGRTEPRRSRICGRSTPSIAYIRRVARALLRPQHLSATELRKCRGRSSGLRRKFPRPLSRPVPSASRPSRDGGATASSSVCCDSERLP